MIKILFICTDNLTRSVIAHYCLQNYINENNIVDIQVDSAGTVGQHFEKIFTAHFDALTSMSIDISKHVQKLLTQEMIDKDTILVAMGKNHKEYVEKTFNTPCWLFNQIALNKNENVQIDWSREESEINKQLRDLVKDINKLIPFFVINFRKRFQHEDVREVTG